jgi:hypothetical protein
LAVGKDRPNAYLRAMFKPFEFCIPTKSTSVPVGPDWLHEVKYDATASAWSAMASACA